MLCRDVTDVDDDDDDDADGGGGDDDDEGPAIAQHYFAERASSGVKAKVALKEWRRMSAAARGGSLLPAPHPDGALFVVFDPERACLARAAIVGSAGTPYAGGLFAFDIFLPATFP